MKIIQEQSVSAHHVGIQEKKMEIFFLEASSERLLQDQYRADWQMEEETKKYLCLIEACQLYK